MFDAVYCINLDRRPERWEAFLGRLPADWPYCQVERVSACDGSQEAVPGYFQGGSGAWGCYQSHLCLWEQIVCQDIESALILEDDAVFAANAVEIMRETMDLVPPGWDQVYFGGQHLATDTHAPEVLVHGKLIRGRNVNRTHAYAISRGFASECIDHVLYCEWPAEGRMHHVDYRLAELHDSHRVYAPWRFCIGQAAGCSDVRSARRRPAAVVEHWWNQFPIVDPVTAGVV